ncbi:hypothetical protein XELAEV_18001673mg [Xenopus laevis]|uniref:Secreted protein n=1 Tax=Xenopus laevis TaxID=8355 RepID=A0A974BNT7_XENLA|nr:hypothetical protein XELAEV_18001673mg [Xenopus laevis]
MSPLMISIYVCLYTFVGGAATHNTRALLGQSNVCFPLQDFMEMENLESDLRLFCQRNRYNVLVSMAITFTSDNEPVRQIAVYSQREELRRVVSMS